MKVSLYPAWAIPAFIAPTVHADAPDFLRVRAMLGGRARARKLSAKALRRIAMAGVRARRYKTTPEQRSALARAAGAKGNAARWGRKD